MNLRKLPGDDDGDVTEDGLHISKGLLEFVRCAVEDDGCVFWKRLKKFGAAGLFLRRVAHEHKVVGWEAGYGERGNCGSRAGDTYNRNAPLDCFTY